MPRKQTAHGELDLLQQQAADARLAVQAAETAHIEAEAALEVAHDKVREAHDLGQDARTPTRSMDKAKRTLEQATLAQQGIEQRLQRAEREVAHFREARGWDLLRERESVARDLAGKLTRAVHEVVGLNTAIVAERVYQDQLIAAIPGLAPRDDGPPGEHAWEETIKQLRRSVARTPELPPLLPRLAGVDARAREEQTKRRLRQERGQDELEIVS